MSVSQGQRAAATDGRQIGTRPSGSVARLVRSAAGNSLAVLGAQAITFLSMTLIARLYGASAVGIQGMVLAVSSVAVALLSFNFANAICIARSDGQALNLARLALAGPTLGLAAAALVALALAPSRSDLSALLMSGAVNLWSIALLAVVTQISFRRRSIGLRSAALLASALLVAALRIGLGQLHATGLVLIGTASLGNIASAALMWWAGARTPLGRFVGGARPASLRHTARRFADFPRYTMPHSLLRYGIMAMPPVAIGAWAGTAAAGQYALAASAVSGPLLLVADAFGDAISRPIAQQFAHDRAGALHAATRLSLVAAAVAAVPLALLLLFPRPLFAIAFGPGWDEAAAIASLLVLWNAAMLVTRPLIVMVPLLGLQRTMFRVEVAGAALRLVSFPALLLGLHSLRLAIAAFALIGTAQTLLLAARVLRPGRTTRAASLS